VKGILLGMTLETIVDLKRAVFAPSTAGPILSSQQVFPKKKRKKEAYAGWGWLFKERVT